MSVDASGRNISLTSTRYLRKRRAFENYYCNDLVRSNYRRDARGPPVTWRIGSIWINVSLHSARLCTMNNSSRVLRFLSRRARRHHAKPVGGGTFVERWIRFSEVSWWVRDSRSGIVWNRVESLDPRFCYVILLSSAPKHREDRQADPTDPPLVAASYRWVLCGNNNL